jgi:hypothetical protein
VSHRSLRNQMFKFQGPLPSSAGYTIANSYDPADNRSSITSTSSGGITLQRCAYTDRSWVRCAHLPCWEGWRRAEQVRRGDEGPGDPAVP